MPTKEISAAAETILHPVVANKLKHNITINNFTEIT